MVTQTICSYEGEGKKLIQAQEGSFLNEILTAGNVSNIDAEKGCCRGTEIRQKSAPCAMQMWKYLDSMRKN